MPKRGAYAGDAGVLGGEGYPQIPMQAETRAYLSRFTGQPSKAYRSALNRAIYAWKQAGAWALCSDLWLFVADSQADALRNLISAARDATIVGSPVFAANIGFAITQANYLNLPFSAAGLTTSSGQAFAARYLANSNNTLVGWCLASDNQQLGAVTTNSGIGNQGFSFAGLNVSGDIISRNQGAYAVGGAVGANVVRPQQIITVDANSTTSVMPSPAQFRDISGTGAWTRAIAYALFPTITAAQLRRFVAILNSFLDEIGALA